MIKNITSLMIIFSMLIISSAPALSYEERQPFEKLREKRFWRKLDRQIKRFQKSVEKLEKMDDKKLEKRIKRLTKKSHHIITPVSVAEIKESIPYFKSEQFALDIKEKIDKEISKYYSFSHFYEQTMNGGRRTLCMMGKVGIWTTAPVIFAGSLAFLFVLLFAAPYIDPGLGHGLLLGAMASSASSILAFFMTGDYRCLPR